MLEIQETQYIRNIVEEAKDHECVQCDPHCAKNWGELCERGCFEVTLDLQTMTLSEREE